MPTLYLHLHKLTDNHSRANIYIKPQMFVCFLIWTVELAITTERIERQNTKIGSQCDVTGFG